MEIASPCTNKGGPLPGNTEKGRPLTAVDVDVAVAVLLSWKACAGCGFAAANGRSRRVPSARVTTGPYALKKRLMHSTCISLNSSISITSRAYDLGAS